MIMSIFKKRKMTKVCEGINIIFYWMGWGDGGFGRIWPQFLEAWSETGN